MGWSAAERRAFGYASAVVVVVLVARSAIATLALSRAAELALDSIASALVMALAAAALGSFAREPLRERLGLGASGLAPGRVALGALGLVALSHAAEGVVELAGFSTAGLVRFDDALAGLSFDQLLLPLGALALASAIGEELFFRGLLQRGLARRIGTAPAIVLASLAFGAAHDDWTHGAAAAVLGSYLGVIAARTGSIRSAIVAHAVNNAVAVIEKVTELQLPGGPIATPIEIAVGVALAGVALAGIRPRPKPADALQLPDGCTDEPGDA
jgi:uncharacterized protein